MTQSFIAVALVLQAATTSLPASVASQPNPVSLRQAMRAPGVYAQPALPLPRPQVSSPSRPRSKPRTFFGAVTGAMTGAYVGLTAGVKIGSSRGNDGDLGGAAIGLPIGTLAGAILGGYFLGK